MLSGLAQWLPDKFWMHVFVNVFVFALGYALSFVFRSARQKSVESLTIRALGSSGTESEG
jgi:hypothetical protein